MKLKKNIPNTFPTEAESFTNEIPNYKLYW